jgi:hypothetical protein
MPTTAPATKKLNPLPTRRPSLAELTKAAAEKVAAKRLSRTGVWMAA